MEMFFLVGNVQGVVALLEEMSDYSIGLDSITCNTFVKEI